MTTVSNTSHNEYIDNDIGFAPIDTEAAPSLTTSTTIAYTPLALHPTASSVFDDDDMELDNQSPLLQSPLVTSNNNNINPTATDWESSITTTEFISTNINPNDWQTTMLFKINIDADLPPSLICDDYMYLV